MTWHSKKAVSQTWFPAPLVGIWWVRNGNTYVIRKSVGLTKMRHSFCAGDFIYWTAKLWCRLYAAVFQIIHAKAQTVRVPEMAMTAMTTNSSIKVIPRWHLITNSKLLPR